MLSMVCNTYDIMCIPVSIKQTFDGRGRVVEIEAYATIGG